MKSHHPKLKLNLEISFIMAHFSVILLEKHISIKYYIIRGQKAQYSHTGKTEGNGW